MFERLPQIYDEVGELQERIDEESRKRDEMEAHLLSYSRENVLYSCPCAAVS